MALSLGATTPTALYLGTTAISAAYLGATQVYTTGGGDAYAIGGASPELVAAFTTQSDGTTAGEYYRKASSATTFSGMFTHSVSGLLTMFDSTGTLVWAPHNYVETQIDGAFWRESNLTHASSAQFLPGLTETMVLLTEDDTVAGSLHRSFLNDTESYIVKTGVKYRFGGFFKTNGRHVVLGENSTSDGFGTAEIKVNLSTGALISETDTDDYGISLVSDGVYYCWIEKEAVNNDTRVRIALCDEAGATTYDGDGVSGLYVGGLHIYRADLGGMADNPDMPAGLEKYVPTTTAAKYLPRSQAYRYNSGWELAGMQMEAAAATNLRTNSRAISTDIDGSNRATLTQNQTGIDGAANTAWTFSDDSSTGSNTVNLVFNVSGLTTGVKYTFSVFGQADQLSWAQIGTNVGGGGNPAFYDLANFATGTVGSGTTARVSRWGDWARLEFTTSFTSTSGSIFLNVVDADNDVTVDLDGTSSIIIDQVQFELGSTASSPIITTGSTVTRAAETLSIAGADTPFNTTGFTIYEKGFITYADNDNAVEASFARIYKDANDSYVWRFSTQGSDTGRFVIRVEEGNVFDTAISPSQLSPGVNVPFSAAVRYTSSDVQMALGGTAGTADTTIPAIADMSAIAFTPLYNFNGYISELRYWGTDLAESGIEEVTT